MRARASEFPNDNAALHRGTVWVLREPCGDWEAEASVPTPTPCAATASTLVTPDQTATILPPPPSALEDEPGDDIEIVDELDPIDFELASSGGDPFADFVGMLVELAAESGCDKAAAILPALLEDGKVAPGLLPEPLADALLANGVLAIADGGLIGGEALRRTAAAWRAILRGDSEDFSSCGPRMLDEWAADLVARLTLSPAKTEGLRRKLRTRGVAAFGLVVAAA
jgi:hypothetical protein